MDDFDTTSRVYWINHIDKTTQLFPPKDDPVDLDSLHPGIKAEVKTAAVTLIVLRCYIILTRRLSSFALFCRPCLSSRPTSEPS